MVPLLARVYPNGKADVNQFQAAGGTGFVIRELLAAGLLHGDVETIVGTGLAAYTQEPWLDGGVLRWRPAPDASGDETIVRPVSASVQRGRRPAADARQPRSRGGQDVCAAARAFRDRGARDRVRGPGRAAGGVQGGQARARLRGCRPLPGAARQRHARTAPADAGADVAAGPRASRSRWSPTAACPAHRARCPRPST